MKKQLVDLIQEIYLTNSETYTVFISVSGHIDMVNFRGCNTGWHRNNDYSLNIDIQISKCSNSDISRIRKEFKADLARGKKLLSDEELYKADEVSRLKARLAELEG